MEFLQTLDLQAVVFGSFCIVGLCVFGVIGSVLLQFVGFGVELFLNLLGLVGEVVVGGPVAWCGCFLVLGGCGVCMAGAIVVPSLISQCDGPQAVNLCRLFGY